MIKSKIQNLNPKMFLGVDGGQSHTEAIVADEAGNILGRGFGGASNHAEQPGGRERLRNAVLQSVGQAIYSIDEKVSRQSSKKENINSSSYPYLAQSQKFVSAYFGMTGGADFKEEIIGEIISAEILTVSHDAPTALFGATAGKPGIVVISGTGSVVYGENKTGETARAGGLGFLFSDEGSGFWLAAQTIRLAIKEQDGLIKNGGLQELVLDFFGRKQIRDITDDFYGEKISRDEIAKFARRAHDAAASGNKLLADEINYGCEVLAKQVQAVAKRLSFEQNFSVSGVGGMFSGQFFKESFKKNLCEFASSAEFINPRFGPAIGALLLAYKQAKIEIEENLLKNLEKIQIR